MTSSRQFGSKKAAVGNTYSIFTPTGIVTRLNDTVESTVFAIDKQSASSRSILTSAFYSLVLGIPLKMCRFVLTRMETILGVKHRPIVNVQRRSLKSRRSSSGRKSTNEKVEDEFCDVQETSPNGGAVKFDFSNSPDASKKMLNVISPNKRRTSALMSQNESTIDEEEEQETSCDEDSSDDEVIDHIKLLNQSDVNYKSEDDSDFDPNESEKREQAERDEEYDEMNTSCDSEPPFEQVAQKSPCLTDHSVVELSFNEEGYEDEVKTAELCEVTELRQKTDEIELKNEGVVADDMQMPLKSTENFAEMDQNGNKCLEKNKIQGGNEVDQENEPQIVA